MYELGRFLAETTSWPEPRARAHAVAKMGGAGAVIFGISGWVWAVDSIYSGLRPMETLRALQGPMALSYRALRTHMDP